MPGRNAWETLRLSRRKLITTTAAAAGTALLAACARPDTPTSSNPEDAAIAQAIIQQRTNEHNQQFNRPGAAPAAEKSILPKSESIRLNSSQVNTRGGDAVWAEYRWGQAFKARASGTLSHIELPLTKIGNPATPLTLEVFDTANAAVLGTITLTPDQLTSSIAWKKLTFPQAAALQLGKTYAIAARATGEKNPNNQYAWGKNSDVTSTDDPAILAMNASENRGAWEKRKGQMGHKVYIAVNPKEFQENVDREPLVLHAGKDFKMKYPQGWRLEQETIPGSNARLRALSGNKVDKFIGPSIGIHETAIAVGSEPVNEKITFAEYVESALGQIKQFAPGAHIETTPIKMMGNNPGMLIRMDTQEGSTMMVLTKKGGTGWKLSLFAHSIIMPEQAKRFTEIATSSFEPL